jgi:hypothetical protein
VVTVAIVILLILHETIIQLVSTNYIPVNSRDADLIAQHCVQRIAGEINISALMVGATAILAAAIASIKKRNENERKPRL